MVASALLLDLEAEKMMVEDALREVLSPGDCPEAQGVAGAMQYSVLGGGQRLRPLLALRRERALRLEVLPAAVAPGVSAPAPRGVALEVVEAQPAAG